MEGQLFPSGIEPATTDFNFMRESIEDQIKNRSSVDIFEPGISGEFAAYVVAGASPNTIKVPALVAYDPAGERINVAADVDNLAPSLVDGITLVTGGAWASSIRYIIVARYVQTEDTPIQHPIDFTLHNIRKHDSYTLLALRRSGPTIDNFGTNDIKLARVNTGLAGTISDIIVNAVDPDELFQLTQYLRLTATKTKSIIGASAPAAYADGQEISLQDLVDCKGTGVRSPKNPHGQKVADLDGLEEIGIDAQIYQRETHTNGIVSSGPFDEGSLNTKINIAVSPNTLRIINLVSGEAAYISGKRLLSSDIVGGTDIAPITGNLDRTMSFVGDPAGTYYIYVNSVGIIQKTSNIAVLADTSVMVISSVAWNGSTTLSSVADLRGFGTMSSRNIQTADLTSGQDTTTGRGIKSDHVQTDAIVSRTIDDADGLTGQDTTQGSGVKTNHLQDSAVTTPKIADGAVTTAKLNVSDLTSGGVLVPIGGVIVFASDSAPAGYLECNGAAISRTTYANLFAVVGTRWGIGDASTTFNLPDLRGRFARGWDHGAGNDPDAAGRTATNGGASGDNVGSKQLDEFKSHTHADYGQGRAHGGGANDIYFDGRDPNATSGAAGGNETRPKNVYMMYIIRTGV